jgi:hypothetical protein
MITNSRTKTEEMNRQIATRKVPAQNHEGSSSPHCQHKFPWAVGEQMIDERN